MAIPISTARSYIADGRHPFRALSQRQRLGIATVLAVAALVVHRCQSVDAKSSAAPHGTTSFALTSRREESDRIRSSWSRSTQQVADRNFRLDMLFSITWTNAITLAGLWAADTMDARGWRAAKVGGALAWAQWGAALLAVTKDVEKVAALRGHTVRVLESVSRWAAITEIATKAIGIAYAAAPAVARLIESVRRHR